MHDIERYLTYANVYCHSFFFFQAEDGIRDVAVTGVQTCALPISFRDGKTILSAGFGVFDVLPLPYLIQFNELFSAPFDQHASVTNLPAGSFPTGSFAIAAASTSSFRQGYFDPHPKRNYVMQWNLTVEHDLTSEVSLRIGYVGSL